MRRTSSLALALLLATTAAGCSRTEPSASDSAGSLLDATVAGQPDYLGPILERDRAGRILVQYRQAGVNSGRIWFAVREDTRIVRRSGRPAAAGELQPGLMVSIWTDEPLMESDPAQTSADAIVIEGGIR